MSLCDTKTETSNSSKCSSSKCCSKSNCKTVALSPLSWFADMIPNCLEYAEEGKRAGKPIVGIMCEYTPREIIMAAGGIPVCLCGGSAHTIPAAEDELPPNLCPLIKSTYGYHVLEENPFLEMSDLVVAETTCDGKKKMYELMAKKRPMHVLELPQKPNDSDAFRHWFSEVVKFKKFLEKKFSVRITKTKLQNAISVMNHERALRRKLAGFMKNSSPPISGSELLQCKSSISGIQKDLEQFEEIINWLPTRSLTPQTQPQIRVLLTGVPMAHEAERVMHIIEDSGGLVVCAENCTGVKPILEDVDENTDDPLEAIAKKYFHLPCSVMTHNQARMDSLYTLANEYQAECVIELVWQSCLTYDIESTLVKQTVQQDLGLPYLRIQTDYSPSDSARIAVRIQAFYEAVHAQTGNSIYKRKLKKKSCE